MTAWSNFRLGRLSFRSIIRRWRTRCIDGTTKQRPGEQLQLAWRSLRRMPAPYAALEKQGKQGKQARQAYNEYLSLTTMKPCFF